MCLRVRSLGSFAMPYGRARGSLTLESFWQDSRLNVCTCLGIGHFCDAVLEIHYIEYHKTKVAHVGLSGLE